MLAKKLKDQLGAPIVVDNRAAAGGQIAAQALKAAAPVAYQPQAQFAQRVKSYTATWDRLIKASGFTPK